MEENSRWKRTEDGVGWGDGGPIEVRNADGTIFECELKVDTWFDGEEELPRPILTKDGKEISFYDAKEWRPRPLESPVKTMLDDAEQFLGNTKNDPIGIDHVHISQEYVAEIESDDQPPTKK